MARKQSNVSIDFPCKRIRSDAFRINTKWLRFNVLPSLIPAHPDQLYFYPFKGTTLVLILADTQQRNQGPVDHHRLDYIICGERRNKLTDHGQTPRVRPRDGSLRDNELGRQEEKCLLVIQCAPPTGHSL